MKLHSIYKCRTCGKDHNVGTYCNAQLKKVGHPLGDEPRKNTKAAQEKGK